MSATDTWSASGLAAGSAYRTTLPPCASTAVQHMAAIPPQLFVPEPSLLPPTRLVPIFLEVPVPVPHESAPVPDAARSSCPSLQGHTLHRSATLSSLVLLPMEASTRTREECRCCPMSEPCLLRDDAAISAGDTHAALSGWQTAGHHYHHQQRLSIPMCACGGS